MARSLAVVEVEVSIPKRVSEALKLPDVFFLGNAKFVSIPKRVSEALKHQARADAAAVNSRSFNP